MNRTPVSLDAVPAAVMASQRCLMGQPCQAGCKNEPDLELQILLCGAILRFCDMKSSNELHLRDNSFFEAMYIFLSGCSSGGSFFRVYDWVHPTVLMDWRRQGWNHPAGASPACSLLHGGVNSLTPPEKPFLLEKPFLEKVHLSST